MSHQVDHATVDVVLAPDPVPPEHRVDHAAVDVVLYLPPAPSFLPSYLYTLNYGWLPLFNPTGTPHDS